MALVTEDEVSLEQLLLDPNNYRFQDTDDFVRAEEHRFHEESVQLRTYNPLGQNTRICLCT
jgi:hypothetical protein